MTKEILVSNRQGSGPAHEVRVGGDGQQIGTQLHRFELDGGGGATPRPLGVVVTVVLLLVAVVPGGWLGGQSSSGVSDSVGASYKSVLLCDRPAQSTAGIECVKRRRLLGMW